MEANWRFIDTPKLRVQFEFEPRDLWIGIFWHKTKTAFHLYVCLMPLLPLHINWRVKELTDGS